MKDKVDNDEDNNEDNKNNYPKDYNTLNKREESFIRGRGGWVVLIVIIALIVLGVLSELITVGYNVKVCYTEKEPYTDLETYKESEPYTTRECNPIDLKYIDGWGATDSVCLNQICDSHKSVCVDTNWYGGCTEYSDVCTHYACTKYKKICRVKIQNIDDTSGTWTVKGWKYNHRTQTLGDFVEEVSVSVKPTQEGTATWEYEYDAGENMGCSYVVNDVPTKQECDNVIKYKDVTKTRDITKYKDVKKTRVEVRQCNLWKKVIGRCYDTSEGC